MRNKKVRLLADTHFATTAFGTLRRLVTLVLIAPFTPGYMLQIATTEARTKAANHHTKVTTIVQSHINKERGKRSP